MTLSIVGVWTPNRSAWNGQATAEEDLRDVTLAFVDGRCEVRRAGVLIRSGRYSDNIAGIPCELDVCFATSDVPELINATLRGIFQIDGDRLRICYGTPGGQRATGFSADEGTQQYLAEYCRQSSTDQNASNATVSLASAYRQL